jgi:hypothetical protein
MRKIEDNISKIWNNNENNSPVKVLSLMLKR